jgi:hypothetical protein
MRLNTWPSQTQQLSKAYKPPRTVSMNQILQKVLEEDPYDQLPESIKATYSRREYLFLSDSQKTHLEQTETEPEVDL